MTDAQLDSVVILLYFGIEAISWRQNPQCMTVTWLCEVASGGEWTCLDFSLITKMQLKQQPNIIRGCKKIFHILSFCLEGELDPFSFEAKSSSLIILRLVEVLFIFSRSKISHFQWNKSLKWIDCADIHGPQRINPTYSVLFCTNTHQSGYLMNKSCCFRE